MIPKDFKGFMHHGTIFLFISFVKYGALDGFKSKFFIQA
jgi:hypothetical protein